MKPKAESESTSLQTTALFNKFVPFAEATLNYGIFEVMNSEGAQQLLQDIAALPVGTYYKQSFHGQNARIFELSQAESTGAGWLYYRMIVAELRTYDRRGVDIRMVIYPDRHEVNIGSGVVADRNWDFIKFTANTSTSPLVFTPATA